MTQYYAFVEGPLGPMMLTSDGDALTGIVLEGQQHGPAAAGEVEDPGLAVFVQAREQLAEYFAGTRTRFDLPLAPRGTPFQREVWSVLETIPYGARLTYSDVAAAVGRPRAARAVGAAIGHNPISIVVPCHRVVGKNGDLTGYDGGIELKRALLELESAHA